MHVHLVFVGTFRHRVFDGDAISRLRTIFAKVCADFEAQLIEMDGEDEKAKSPKGNFHKKACAKQAFLIISSAYQK